jgi:hypothetical protein
MRGEVFPPKPKIQGLQVRQRRVVAHPLPLFVELLEAIEAQPLSLLAGGGLQQRAHHGGEVGHLQLSVVGQEGAGPAGLEEKLADELLETLLAPERMLEREVFLLGKVV